MENSEQIKNLLISVIENPREILKLEEYDIKEIIEVALANRLYSSLMIIFQPITIDGVVKIYFDAFSTDILQIIQYAYDTEEQAEQAARKEYERIQKKNREMPDDERKMFGEDNRTYEQILAIQRVIPKEIKDALRESLFKIDMDLIGKIKIKDSHAREISGIGHPISSIEDVIFYAEPSCIKACIDLFNKNIRTTMNDTEGVIEDATITSGICFITCDYKSLSDQNKDIFDELIKSGSARRFIDRGIDSVSIDVPCDGDETVEAISQKLQSIVSKIKEQDVLYGRQTLGYFWEHDFVFLADRYPRIYHKYFDKEGYTWDDVIDFAKEFGYYYDSEEDLLWDNQILYEKHKDYLKRKSQKPKN